MAALLMMAGCAVESQTNMGGFVVKLHDAPADYDEVNVFIERVEVNNTTDGQGWQIISEPMRSYNLLELTNGVFEVIADTELEVGTYPQIRLIVSRDQNNVKINGETHGLFIPSGAQTGIKLNVDAEIRDGIVYTLLLDFDALRSVVRTGQASSERFLLKPVIRATNEALTGNISGTIVPIEARAVVYAIAGSDTLSTTFADEVTGEFLLVGLEEGVYDVSVEAREDNYTGSTVNDVDVTVNETTTLEPIVLESE
ncbi:MAG: DUF4382 domain-containing protein [Balneolia bacterium]|nr:DUF4382 domain-containing protein [Balneolia bacterium]